MDHVKADGQTYNAVDVAKFVCSLLVVMIHVAPLGAVGNHIIVKYINFFWQYYLAKVAVSFFFVSSGFFLFRKMQIGNFDKAPIKRYVLRLLRLYCIWSVIYLPLNIVGCFGKEEGFVALDLLKYVRDFIFTGSYRHLWYLNATIFAVILISFLLKGGMSPRKIMIIAFGFYFTGLFAQSWFGVIAPLQNAVPAIWKILISVQKIIVTTRDGLFEGFFFIGLGMLFAFYEFPLTRKRAIVGFCVSMGLLLVEILITWGLKLSRAGDMYLSLIPAAFFMFYAVYRTKLPDSRIYRKLRTLSSLVFYMHYWVKEVVCKILFTIDERMRFTCAPFVITLSVTLICASIVMALSENFRWKWIKKIY